MTRRPHDELRAEAIALASATIAKSGIEALAARDLAKSAGCSVGTLYNVFGDLDGVVAAVNLRTIRALRQTLERVFAQTEPNQGARLTAMALAYHDFAAQNPGAWDGLFRYKRGPDVPDEIRAEVGGLTELLRSALPGSPSPDKVKALWAAVHGVVDLALYQHLGRFDAPDEARAIIQLVVGTALSGFENEDLDAG